jgi:hypothetical protein
LRHFCGNGEKVSRGRTSKAESRNRKLKSKKAEDGRQKSKGLRLKEEDESVRELSGRFYRLQPAGGVLRLFPSIIQS